MCLIAVKPKNAPLPNEEHLRNGEANNQDGIGCCYWKEGSSEVHIKKDFKTIDELLSFLKKNIKKEDALIVHFRFATSGLKDAGNRHPFPLTTNWEMMRKTELVCQYAVAHNGVIREYGDHKKYSDTQKFVMDILSQDGVKTNLEDDGVYKLIQNFIGTDRLAVLEPNGEIVIFGSFDKEGDILYSNSNYKWRTNRYRGVYGNGHWGGCRDFDNEEWDGEKHEWVKKKKLLTHSHSEASKSEAVRSYTAGKPFDGECDGCSGSDGKFKKVMVLRNPTHPEIFYYLCKPCRKKFKKGLLDFENQSESTAECGGCGQQVSEKLLEYVLKFGCKLCPKCKEDYPTLFAKK